MTLQEALQAVRTADEAAVRECRRRWDSLAKPLKSLGRLEEAVAVIAGITGTSRVSVEKKALVIMCADNGVVAEGVTQTGQEVTAIVAENFGQKKASVSIMAECAGADVFPVDMGIVGDTGIIQKKIARGTKNMAVEPAMTRQEAVRAVEAGIQLIGDLKNKGYQIVATGEMGIGNTTTSSAMASVFLNRPVECMTGRGAGLSDEGLAAKIRVIKQAVKCNNPDRRDPLDVLAKLGGFDIAGMTGLFIGGAVFGLPVVMDGFISAVAALTAVRLHPGVRSCILPSHMSKEPAAKELLKELDMEAFLTCGMCLGEGSGAVALFPLLDMAVSVYRKMSTFEQIHVEAYQPL